VLDFAYTEDRAARVRGDGCNRARAAVLLERVIAKLGDPHADVGVA
jgi:hypothetical protein